MGDTLADTTVSEWLLFHAPPDYRGVVRSLHNPSSAQLGAALIPDDRDLPEASAEIRGVVGDPSVTGTASVGNRLLRYSKSAKKGPGPDPVEVTDTLEANLGPVSLYKKWGSGSRETGAHGILPWGPGWLRAGVDHASRSTPHVPDVTDYRLGYEGKVGQGILGLHGNVADIDRIGRGMGASGTFKVPIFGGDLLASAYLQRQPREYKRQGAKNDYGVGLRWGKSF
mgnify:CR=1 FL=1|jgi:hypothetical protein|tara:strand:- start:118 stop:795 length:678 start_codon:yes stop_codon:yes gene_type:complete